MTERGTYSDGFEREELDPGRRGVELAGRRQVERTRSNQATLCRVQEGDVVERSSVRVDDSHSTTQHFIAPAERRRHHL